MKETTKMTIDTILKDYHWMMKSISILRESMKDVGVGLTTRYGEESDMPKAQGISSDPVYKETVRRAKRYKKVVQYEEKVKLVQNLIHVIEDNREIEILHWLLEGKSYRWIGKVMDISFSQVKRMRDSIIDKLTEEAISTEYTKETKLNNGHSA